MSLEEKHELTGTEFGDPTKFDPDLAKRVAEDGQKLTAGKISEAEFYHKHHEEYLKVFGVDNRPINQSDIVESKPPASPLTKSMSRRTLLKLGGITLASMAGAKLLSGSGIKALAAPITGKNNKLPLVKAPEPPPTPTNVQMGMVIDLEKCDGCLSCVYACQSQNFNMPGVFFMYVLAFKDINKEGPNFLVRNCQHCGNPPCVKVCPVRARHKRTEDGLVLTDYNLCIGCRYCMVTCPYGVNYFQWGLPDKKNYFHDTLKDKEGRWVIGTPPRGCMGKCTYNPDRQDDGRKNTVCQLVCPQNVIHFGDIHDPNSEPNQYLAKRIKDSNGNLSVFHLLENQGTKPSATFIGQQPTRAAVPIDGPVKYSDWGLVETRLDELNGPRPWFLKAFGGQQ